MDFEWDWEEYSGGDVDEFVRLLRPKRLPKDTYVIRRVGPRMRRRIPVVSTDQLQPGDIIRIARGISFGPLEKEEKKTKKRKRKGREIIQAPRVDAYGEEKFGKEFDYPDDPEPDLDGGAVYNPED